MTRSTDRLLFSFASSLVIAMTLTAQNAIPELDKNAPKETRTATFALG